MQASLHSATIALVCLFHKAFLVYAQYLNLIKFFFLLFHKFKVLYQF